MRTFHELWIEQCEAARDIREEFGLDKAIGYLVGKKLLAFLRDADQVPASPTSSPGSSRRSSGSSPAPSYAPTSTPSTGSARSGHVASDKAYEEMREVAQSEHRNFERPCGVSTPSLLPPVARHDRAPGGRSQGVVAQHAARASHFAHVVTAADGAAESGPPPIVSACHVDPA